MIKNNYWAYDFVEATQFMIENCDEKIIAMYHITADDRVMGGINKAKKLTQTVKNSKYTTAEGEEIQRIYVSTLCPNDTEPFDTSSYAYELAKLSGGIAVTGYVANEDTEVMTAEVEDIKVYASNTDETKTSSNVKKSLTAILGEGNNRIYRTIMSNGLVYVKLDTPLRYDDFYKSQNLVPTDTDHDGLYDWHEVDIDYINKFLGAQSKETIGTDDLPTIGMYVSDYSDVEYVQQGYEELILRSAYTKYYGDKEAAKADIDNYRILPIISDPTLEDGDYDGVNDNDDPEKLSNKFTGVFSDKDYEINAAVEFKVDYTQFFTDEFKYNKNLSTFASLLAHDVYEERYVMVNDLQTKAGYQDSPFNMALSFGLEDVKDVFIYNPNALHPKITDVQKNFQKEPQSDMLEQIAVYDDDVTEAVIGHRTIEKEGDTRDVIMIIVRGTNGTIEEWSSNFDVGANTVEYYTAMGLSMDDEDKEWENPENHKGFDVAANRVLEYIYNDYIEKYCKNGYDKSFLVTGHSRGATIANLIAKDLIDNKNYNDKVFGYTFAAPNNTTSSEHDSEKYNSIFNIVNTDDLIPSLPLGEPYSSDYVEYSDWGFTKYGVIKSFSIKENCERKWENISGITDYNSNGNLSDTLVAFGKIIDTSGEFSRNALYEYTNSDDACVSFNVLNYIDDQKTIDEFKKLYSERIVRFCKIKIEGKSPSLFDSTKHKVIIEQTPAFLMMDLVGIVVSEERGGKPNGMLGYDVADKYENAKLQFIHSGIDSKVHLIGLGGMRDPHLPISYYVIASEIN